MRLTWIAALVSVLFSAMAAASSIQELATALPPCAVCEFTCGRVNQADLFIAEMPGGGNRAIDLWLDRPDLYMHKY